MKATLPAPATPPAEVTLLKDAMCRLPKMSREFIISFLPHSSLGGCLSSAPAGSKTPQSLHASKLKLNSVLKKNLLDLPLYFLSTILPSPGSSSHIWSVVWVPSMLSSHLKACTGTRYICQEHCFQPIIFLL